SDTAKVAVELMKRHGVSQLPVVDGDKPIAMLHEVDLLQALLEGRHELEEPVSAVMKPIDGVVTLRTPVSRLRELFAKDPVAIVKDGDQVAAIVTKIDLIEFLAARRSSPDQGHHAPGPFAVACVRVAERGEQRALFDLDAVRVRGHPGDDEQRRWQPMSG